MSYSQNNEQEVIEVYFKNNTGRILEIGAWNAEHLSNSRSLILRGWSAVMIEPSPKHFYDLLQFYKNSDQITLINAAIVGKPVTAPLIPYYDSGGDESHRQKWNNNVFYIKYLCPAIHIEAVYAACGMDYDFITLDLGADNYEILKTLNLEMCDMICVAYDDKRSEMLDYLHGNGLYLVHENSNKIICGR